MAGATLELFCDVDNNRLVRSLNSQEAYEFQGFYQGSQLPIKFTPVRSKNTPYAPFFTKVPIDPISLQIAIGPRAGAEATLAKQYTWSKVYDPGGSTGYLSAILDLNTTEINTALATADTFPTYFEIRMAEDGIARVVFQKPITLYAVVIGPVGNDAVPVPANQFMTSAEILALMNQFVRFTNNPPGATITLTSELSAAQRILGARDDGSAQDDMVMI